MKRLWIPAGLMIGALVLGACGSSPPATTTTTSTTTTTVRSNATAAITTNWIEFFSGNTAASRKIALLQNGSQFAQIIEGQASSAQAKSVHATVTKVANIKTSTAEVHYNIFLGTTEALANQTGEAVLQSGTWKVSDASFCVLLGLEFVHDPACPTS